MPRKSVGEFEHQVLLAVLQLGGEAYSVPIVVELEERAGREVSQAAVFIALRRLEAKGLLRSRVSGEEGSARPRRYFEVTAAGLEQARSSRAALLRLWEGLEAVLDRP